MPTSNPLETNALTLLVQFCLEYADSMTGRPATAEAVKIQVRDAARILFEAIKPTEGEASGSPTD